MTSPDLDDLIRNCGHEIGTGPYEQSPEVLRAGESTHGAAARHMLYQLLDAKMRREFIMRGASAQRIAGSSTHGSPGTPEMRVNQGK